MLLVIGARGKVWRGPEPGLGTGPGARVWGWDPGRNWCPRLMLRLDMLLTMVPGLAGFGTKAWIWGWCRFGVLMSEIDAQAGARLVSWADSDSRRC